MEGKRTCPLAGTRRAPVRRLLTGTWREGRTRGTGRKPASPSQGSTSSHKAQLLHRTLGEFGAQFSGTFKTRGHRKLLQSSLSTPLPPPLPHTCLLVPGFLQHRSILGQRWDHLAKAGRSHLQLHCLSLGCKNTQRQEEGMTKQVPPWRA